jgi:hypothetical protein
LTLAQVRRASVTRQSKDRKKYVWRVGKFCLERGNAPDYRIQCQTDLLCSVKSSLNDSGGRYGTILPKMGALIRNFQSMALFNKASVDRQYFVIQSISDNIL